MTRLLMLAQKVVVFLGHVIAPPLHDLVDGLKVGIIVQGSLYDGCLQVITPSLGVLGFAPLKDLCEHAVNILWYSISAEDIAVENPQVHSV